MTKPTIEEVIAAAKECGAYKVPMSFVRGSQISFREEQLQAFALHWYRQGLLSAQEKCEEIDFEDSSVDWRRGTLACAIAISDMAKELK